APPMPSEPVPAGETAVTSRTALVAGDVLFISGAPPLPDTGKLDDSPASSGPPLAAVSSSRAGGSEVYTDPKAVMSVPSENQPSASTFAVAAALRSLSVMAPLAATGTIARSAVAWPLPNPRAVAPVAVVPEGRRLRPPPAVDPLALTLRRTAATWADGTPPWPRTGMLMDAPVATEPLNSVPTGSICSIPLWSFSVLGEVK